MEKNKINKALIILVIIFGIIILGLSTFIVYDKVIKKDEPIKDEKTTEEKTETNNNTNDNVNSNENNNEQSSKINMLDNFNEKDMYVKAANVVYEYTVDGNHNIYNQHYYIACGFGGEDKGKIFVKDYAGGEKIYINTNKKFKSCNTVDTTYGDTTLDSMSITYILFEDGTISYITGKDIIEKKYQLTPLNGISNIEYFFHLKSGDYQSGDYYYLYGVDKNGKLNYITNCGQRN